MQTKPIIGLSGSWLIDTNDISPCIRRSYINHDYVRSVADNGGIPLIIPFIDNTDLKHLAEQWVNRIDGLILSGGHDINPALYGEEPRPKLEEIWPARDHFDITLLETALKQGKPVLGICRGFQLINVYYGGKLLQDLSYADHELLKHNQGHTPDLATHKVTLKPGTELAELFGEELMVNSFHHQVVTEAGRGLTVSATSSDGVIEAVENKELKILATQWHPEMMSASCDKMTKLFQYFIAKAH